MSQKDAPQDPPVDPAEAEGTEAKPAPARSRKKLILLAAAVLAVLGGGGGSAFFFLRGDDAGAAGEEAAAEPEAGGEEAGATLVDVPVMVVNIRSPATEPRYIKLRFMLVAKSAEKVEAIKGQVPALIDAFQPFLRELRPEDLGGSAAIYRVKEELFIRATEVLGKDSVRDVLIQELMQQ